MLPKLIRPLVFAVVCLSCTSMLAQEKAPRERLIAARAQYYTPTARGLKSFHCEAAIDWKAMLSRFGGTQIPDDNPVLKYLQTVHLSVADQLRGTGTLEWTDTDVPPAGKEQSVKQMRDGLQTMMGGFFQSWNAYMNGSMVPFPDKTVTLTAVGDGVHLSGTSASVQFDEDFDKDMLLTQGVVETPAMRVIALPTYVRTEDGLVVSSVASRVNQPPTAPPAEVTFRVEYAEADSFQLPSRVTYDIKNVGVIEVSLNACHASLGDSAQKPVADKSTNPTN